MIKNTEKTVQYKNKNLDVTVFTVRGGDVEDTTGLTIEQDGHTTFFTEKEDIQLLKAALVNLSFKKSK